MYIVLSGAHGIGKTTLAKKLADVLNAEFLTESIDESIPPPTLGTGGSDPLRAELWFVRQMLLKEAQMSDRKKIYVSDRGWADISAYANVILDEHARNLLRSVTDHLPRRMPDVHVIVDAPKETILARIKGRGRSAADGWNEFDEEYLGKIIGEFRAFHTAFKDLRPVHLVDVRGSVDDNLQQVLAAVTPYLP